MYFFQNESCDFENNTIRETYKIVLTASKLLMIDYSNRVYVIQRKDILLFLLYTYVQ